MSVHEEYMTRSRPELVMVVALLMTSLMVSPRAIATTSMPLSNSHSEFCSEVQRRLVDTTLPIANILEKDYEAFKLSKPAVSPLRTHQYVLRNERLDILQISCKTKTADHLRSVHGIGAARDPALAPRACSDVHRAMILDIWQALGPGERASARFRPSEVMLQTDRLSYTGSSWIKTEPDIRIGDDGKLRLRASALFAEWEDWRWKVMPESWRGNHYCHLVSPEVIRRHMLTGG
jgi:hypothetical protein